MLLPFVLVFMLLLVNRPRLMGAFKNKGWQNLVAWSTAVTMIVLTVRIALQQHCWIGTKFRYLFAGQASQNGRGSFGCIPTPVDFPFMTAPDQTEARTLPFEPLAPIPEQRFG